MTLLPESHLPDGFTYPDDLLRIVEHGLLEPHPWWILTSDPLIARAEGVRQRYPDRTLVPFARRQDNDDVACFEVDGEHGPVVVIHDFATPGWEQRASYPSTYAWFRQAVDDFIAFEE